MNGKQNYFYFIAAFIFFVSNFSTSAQNLSINVNADLVSRYVWRGLNINDQPNVQPAITLKLSGLQFGFWGSYGLSHTNTTDESHSTSHEIDTWISYSFTIENSVNITAIVTDYYYPNGAVGIGNFNNYDNKNGPGAHVIEAGVSIGGPELFPLTFSSYVNVHNDAGSNAYFQIDYLTKIEDYGLGFFIGAAAGSKSNPSCYGTENFNLINIGLKASKQIKITENFSLPVYCSYVLNPRAEISYLIFGISI